MRLLFKQRFFSWFDSYDVYDEAGETLYTVKGQLSWGHCFKIFDAQGEELGTVRQKLLTWLPKFEIYFSDSYIGSVSRELSFFRPKYNIDYKGWSVEGDFAEWDYNIYDMSGNAIAFVTKELFNWTDTYLIDVDDPNDALTALMLVIAIDAEKCSRRD